MLYFLVDGRLDSGIPDHGILIRGMLLHATIGGTINSVANGKVSNLFLITCLFAKFLLVAKFESLTSKVL